MPKVFTETIIELERQKLIKRAGDVNNGLSNIHRVDKYFIKVLSSLKSTKIEWTEATWNPSTGCTKISAGCKNCYAERMAHRLHAMGLEKYRNGFRLSLHPEVLQAPYSWKSPKTVFVNSMSDLFHEEMPFPFIIKVFKVMNPCPEHTIQGLTKRAAILFEYNDLLTWVKNIWMGVSIENAKHVNRMETLNFCDANVKFLSMEPFTRGHPIFYLKK